MNPPASARTTAGRVNGKIQQAVHAAAASGAGGALPPVEVAPQRGRRKAKRRFRRGRPPERYTATEIPQHAAYSVTGTDEQLEPESSIFSVSVGNRTDTFF